MGKQNNGSEDPLGPEKLKPTLEPVKKMNEKKKLKSILEPEKKVNEKTHKKLKSILEPEKKIDNPEPVKVAPVDAEQPKPAPVDVEPA